MDSEKQRSLLSKPIADLGLSRDFIIICELAGFFVLGDLLQRHTSELLALPGFTYHWLEEYVNFLESNDLGYYIDRG